MARVRASRVALSTSSALTYAFLYLPIVVLIVYGFSASRYAISWGGFSLSWYTKLFQNEVVADALATSLLVGFLASLGATVLGTLLAIGLDALARRPARSSFSRWARRGLDALTILPLIIPEIVMAVGLLLFFLKIARPALADIGLTLDSLPAVVMGHVAFATSYVMVVVRARLQLIDPAIGEAAVDLGAKPWQVLTRVTLPLLTPALVGGALLAFTLSLDDFYVTYFATVGGSGFKTLPLYLFALQGKSGASPEINALASLMLLGSLVLAALALLFQGQK